MEGACFVLLFEFMTLLTLLTSTVVVFASGFGPQDLNPPCHKSAFMGSAEDLAQVVDVNINVNDTRAPVTKAKLKMFKISAAEWQQIRKSTGKCVCQGARPNDVVSSSCSLIGDADQVTSNVHLFNNKNGGTYRSCVFQNQADPPDDPVPLVFEHNSYRFGTERPLDFENLDRAVVRLSRPIPGAKPFPINPSGAKLKVGQPILSVSFYQQRLKMASDGRQPIVQECKVQELFAEDGYMTTDCSSTFGGSASIQLTRSTSGELEAVGITVGGGKEEKDGQPYSLENGSYVKNLIMDQNFVKQLNANRRNHQMAQDPNRPGQDI